MCSDIERKCLCDTNSIKQVMMYHKGVWVLPLGRHCIALCMIVMLTSSLKSQLTTDNTGTGRTPRVVADATPGMVDTNFNPTFKKSCTSNQSNLSICAVSKGRPSCM